jgi:hypothetical protein
LLATLRNAVTGVGEPSYTSGVQKWKGTALILNPNPATINAIAPRTARHSQRIQGSKIASDFL